MLIVLTSSPVASPFKSFLNEKFVAQVVVIYLIGETLCAVAILHSCGRLHIACTVFAVFVVGIVEGIDVYSQPAGMLRELGGAADGGVTEA